MSPQPGVYDYNGDGVANDDDFTPLYTGGTCTQYYEDRINIRDDTLYSLNFETDIVDGLMFKATYYQEDKDGFGVSPDSYSNTLGRYLGQAAVGLDVVWPRGVQYGLSEVGGTRTGWSQALNGMSPTITSNLAAGMKTRTITARRPV